jgi:hypothetical protein
VEINHVVADLLVLVAPHQDVPQAVGVPEIVHHVPEIVHHVPEIVHHVHPTAVLEIAQRCAMQVVAVAMIAPVQRAMFQMVALSAIHEVSVPRQWIAIHLACVHEFSNQIFLNTLQVKNLRRAFAQSY